MLDAAYNESAKSQANIYHWYNEFKSASKNMGLMGRLGTPTITLIELSTLAQPWSRMILI